jgi:hypothetical protein
MAKPDMIDLRATDALPTNPEGQTNGTRTLSQIKNIIVHWWGTPTIADEIQQLRSGSRYHAFERDWNLATPGITHARRLTYHLAIGQSGQVYWINNFTVRSWHVNNGNDVAIGINHMIGEGQTPSAAMLASSKQTLDWLTQERPDIPALRGDVWGHGECGGVYGGGPKFGASSSCPGPDLLEWTRAYRKDQPAPVAVPPTPVVIPPTHTFFPQTGFSVGNAIKDYHDLQGGVGGHLGFPLSDEFQGMIPDGGDKVFTLQLFERGVVHFFPGEGCGEVRTGPMLRAIFEKQGSIVSLEGL